MLDKAKKDMKKNNAIDNDTQPNPPLTESTKAASNKGKDKINEKNNEEMDSVISDTMSKMEKEYGNGSVMLFGRNKKINCEVIPTGSFGLNLMLGVGGLPLGRIVEIYGSESSGKTTMALQTVAKAQKIGHLCAFIDAEHALDVKYMKQLGVDIDRTIIAQPDHGEMALSILESLIKSGNVRLIVVDSVASLIPKSELEGEMGDSHIGLQARLMSQALKKIISEVHKNNTLVIFINQTRSKIGISFTPGGSETTTGGLALKFYSSVRLEVKKIGTLFKGTVNKEVYGSRTRVKVVKNKLSAPFKETEFDLIYGLGVCSEGEVCDYATDCGIIKKNGSWYTYNGQNLAQGRNNVIELFKNNKELLDEIKKSVIEKYQDR